MMRIYAIAAFTVIALLSFAGVQMADEAAKPFATDFRYPVYFDMSGDRKDNPEPQQIYGPIYSVGPLTVNVFLVKTAEGLILFDAGYRRDSTLVLENIRKLGFDPADVKKVFVSHWHGDHSGGGDYFARHYGAEVMVHERDAGTVRTGVFLGDTVGGPTENVVATNDGQMFDFGDVTVKVIHTPGQTPGEVVYLITVDGPQGKCVALAAGDAPGFKSNMQSFMHSRYPGVVQDYEKTVVLLKSLEFDLYLGGHGHQVWDEMCQDGNPFVTRANYLKMVDNRHARMRTFIEEHPEFANY